MFKLILRTLESEMTLRLPIITCLAGVMNIGIYIHIDNDFY